MPARRMDTGVDNGGWVRGCRCPEMPVRRVGTGMGTELGTELVFRALPMRRVDTGVDPGG